MTAEVRAEFDKLSRYCGSNYGYSYNSYRSNHSCGNGLIWTGSGPGPPAKTGSGSYIKITVPHFLLK